MSQLSALPSCFGISLALAVTVPVMDSPSLNMVPAFPSALKVGIRPPAVSVGSSFIKAMVLIPGIMVEDDHSSLKGDLNVILQRKESGCWMVPKSSTVLHTLALLLAIDRATNLASSL